jgi:hypothetical protein
MLRKIANLTNVTPNVLLRKRKNKEDTYMKIELNLNEKKYKIKIIINSLFLKKTSIFYSFYFDLLFTWKFHLYR